MNKSQELLEKLKDLEYEIADLSANGLKESYLPFDQINELIAQKRKDQKVNLQQLADLTGLSYATVQSICKGQKKASLENWLKVLSALGVSLWLR